MRVLCSRTCLCGWGSGEPFYCRSHSLLKLWYFEVAAFRGEKIKGVHFLESVVTLTDL